MIERQTLGRRLRSRRLELRLTLQGIADRMGIVPMYISDIEREKRCPMKDAVLRAIAAAYELPLDEVIDLAMGSRDTVQLDTRGQGSERRDFAVKLARAWAEIPDEKIDELRKVLEAPDG